MVVKGPPAYARGGRHDRELTLARPGAGAARRDTAAATPGAGVRIRESQAGDEAA